MGHNGTRRKSPLISGRFMTCPRCKNAHDVLQYMALMMIEEYEDETHPIYKCPQCRWLFSPAEHISEEVQFRVG